MLDIADVQGKRLVVTRLHRNVTIREESAAAALELMSRFAANPKWLILLQPAVKCRGREDLRIIYGPEYTQPEHLQRLPERGLSGKRLLALRSSRWASRASNASYRASP